MPAGVYGTGSVIQCDRVSAQLGSVKIKILSWRRGHGVRFLCGIPVVLLRRGCRVFRFLRPILLLYRVNRVGRWSSDSVLVVIQGGEHSAATQKYQKKKA